MKRLLICCSVAWFATLLGSNQARAAYIYWSEYGTGTIRRANLDGSSPMTLVRGLNNPVGPALDVAGGKMYWGDFGSGTIRRANLDGTGSATIVSGLVSTGTPNLDLVNRQMYWQDSALGKIFRAGLDGSGKTEIITGLTNPRKAALDLAGGKIYWSDAGHEDTTSDGDIRRANLDGTGVETVLPGLPGPRGIALDVAGGKMYWSDYRTYDIRRANLDGSGQEILLRSQPGPVNLALDLGAGIMYWTDFDAGDIRRANLDGTVVTTVVRGLSNPVGVTLDVPEPAAASLIVMWAAGIARRRRKLTPPRFQRWNIDPLEQRVLLSTFTVDTTSDITDPDDGRTTLREALGMARADAGADLINFAPALTALAPATIMPMLELEVDTDVTIEGPGSNLLAIDANSVGRVANVSGTAQVAISGLTITKGAAERGGAILNRGTLILSRCIVVGNTSMGEAGGGGGIYNDGTLTLEESTVTENQADLDGGGILNTGTLTIARSTVSNNLTTTGGIFFGSGGGIRNLGTLSINDSTISGNSAAGIGGGIYSALGTVTLTRSIVLGNSASYGGGVGNFFGSTLRVAGTVIDGNQVSGAGSRGGGIASSGVVSIVDSTLSENSSESGGGIFNDAGASLTLSASTISGNSAEAAGGIYNAGTLALIDCTIASNRAIDVPGNISAGGILDVPGSTLSLSRTSVSENSGAGVYNDVDATAEFEGSTVKGHSAGGIYNAGTCRLSDSSVSENVELPGVSYGGITNTGMLTLSSSAVSDNSGGGIGNSGKGTVSLLYCTISGNSTMYGAGGGIYNIDGSVVVTSSSVVGNSASAGGGIFSDGALVLTNSTVSGNSGTSPNRGGGILYAGAVTIICSTIAANHVASRGVMSALGGGLASYASPSGIGAAVVVNSIIAGNYRDTTGSPDDVYGDLSVSQSHSNLIGTGGSGGLVDGVNGNKVGVADPKLAPLGNYGGPTPTMPLLPGSPALDAGENSLAVDVDGKPLATDQRGPGFARIANGTVDIGAFEAQPAAAVVVARHVFYNHSSFDGNNVAANAADDVAAATDKNALLASQDRLPGFDNVTSFDKGINGVIVDIAGLPDGGALSADDFDFGTARPPREVAVRRGAGVDGSDRATLVWPDFNPLTDPATMAVGNGWLTITVKANGHTGLAATDVFSFGNLIGDANGDRRVNALDVAAVKRALSTSADVTSNTDVNRDGRTTALDVALVKRNLNHSLMLPGTQPVQPAVAPPSAAAQTPLRPVRLWDEDTGAVLA